jgi:hypothetical protein
MIVNPSLSGRINKPAYNVSGMPIETTCQTCGQRLRVADEHAGKAARCPNCQTIYTVPHPAGSATAAAVQPAPFSPGAGSDRWHLRTPDGPTYGPVTKAELDAWVQQGRVTAQSQLASETNGHWVWAGAHYPQLGSPALASTHAVAAPAPNQPQPNPFGEFNPASPYGYATSPYLEQHRGPVILTLAIVGIFVCDIVSIIAIIMAIIDLGKMSKGTMDPGGRGLTIAGLVIALIKIAVIGIFFGAMALSNAL